MNLNSMMTDATIDDAMKDSCFRDSVMVGCKRIDSTEFEVLAWSPRDIVLMEQDTGINHLKQYTLQSVVAVILVDIPLQSLQISKF